MFDKSSKIKDSTQIIYILNRHMISKKLLAAIFDASKNLVYEGARPISKTSVHDTGEIIYTLSNSDSNYTTSIGNVKLADIGYVIE